MFQSIDPSNETPVDSRPFDTPQQVEDKLAATQQAFGHWRQTGLAERARCAHALAGALRDDRNHLASLMTREMGKPAGEAQGEVDKAAWCFEHFADHAEEYLRPVDLPSDARRSYYQHLPLGPVLGILPWNAPLWLAARFAAPTLMAGNSVLVKHDEHVPGCAKALEAHAAEVLPAGLMQFLFTDIDGSERVLRDGRVRAASFTGSPTGGRAVAGIAGSEGKPVVLELGGSDPAIVLADADIQEAAETIKTSRMINAGQSCIAAKRILVERSVYEDFLASMQDHIEALHMGDPGEPDTDIGPLARSELRIELHRQVSASIEQGARCLLGGDMPSGPGCFYPATLLADVPRNATAMNEETFGPVAAVTPVEDADDAVGLANANRYGLAASIWTRTARGEALAARLETGQVAVNGLVKTDPRLPSGGVKESGIGRELGPHGIREFVNVQQVWVG